MTFKKQLIGTKFLFDEDIISYKDLVELMEKTELFDTRFIQKPIKDESRVHSIYIKLDFEVAYLGKSPSADQYYKTAEYYNTPEHGYANYRETTLLDFLEDLDLLEYIKPKKQEKEISQVESEPEEIKPKKQKYISISYGDNEYTIKKKKISFISYNKVRKKLYIRLKNTCIENIYMSEEEYIRIKDSLES